MNKEFEIKIKSDYKKLGFKLKTIEYVDNVEIAAKLAAQMAKGSRKVTAEEIELQFTKQSTDFHFKKVYWTFEDAVVISPVQLLTGEHKIKAEGKIKSLILKTDYELKQLCNKFDYPLFPTEISSNVINLNTLGYAKVYSNKIVLNSLWLPFTSDSFTRDTILHEFAHLISYWKFGPKGVDYSIKEGHTLEWKSIMHNFGLSTKGYD